ncbi:unnamed protein product (macronuclear) [Paramecium tetraurelia]|uniref:Uncharacterized protein n=1 Tax=Paramecium tetraurelia TaxID=5888 RepID=A0E3X3_PARTE|nr:uncharacterized protein GSPATT00023163001 [Paramecium tetraurelia]CAK89990.1 unnamed protein product [Paramecium tetraurelia]|eukprot:XP_001457387.1 hypothetical protein (macronuclear) [Paramecium tetraurelia strain d4-2]
MGACHTSRQRRQSNVMRISERISPQKLDFTCQRLSLYLELVGDTHTLGGYLQERIQTLVEIKQKLYIVTCQQSKMKLLHEASEIIEYLYNDKHFSQAFPILRESLLEITQVTFVTE